MSKIEWTDAQLEALSTIGLSGQGPLIFQTYKDAYKAALVIFRGRFESKFFQPPEPIKIEAHPVAGFVLRNHWSGTLIERQGWTDE